MRTLLIFILVHVHIFQTFSISTELIDLLIDKYNGNYNNVLNLNQLQDLLDVVRGNSKNKHHHHQCQERDIICNVTNQCLSSKELLEAIGYSNLADENVRVDNDTINRLCPLILTQIETGICVSDRNQSSTPTSITKSSHLEVWGYGILFVTLISLCSLVGVSVLPFMGKSLYQRLLTFLIGLAVGSLSGSAVFHLIPQAFDLISEDDDDHDYLFISLVVMGGIYLFFMTECLMKILMEARKTQEHKHEHHIEFKPGKDSAIATVAWMIIFGDGLHNFIDGLSIGAAFNKSILTGVSISVAVLCEEFPHELGDFAVLLNAGMTMKQAMMYNFLSACTCYLGLVVGVLLGELAAASTYIFALAGGMFLYISLVDMIPEMNETLKIASQESVSKALVILLLQNLGWITGVTTLFTLAYYNNKIIVFI